MENDEQGPCLQRMTGGTLRPGGLTLTDRALELCHMSREARVLDAGCGNGVTSGISGTDTGLGAVASTFPWRCSR
jgi:cyclopropane fatty-acyl-phospholipid synthase-like methyltransferase